MISTKSVFKNAKDVQEAIALFQEYQGEAVYLSGGTDLVPRMKLGLNKPKAIIDLKRIAPMSAVDGQGDWIRIGALARIFDLKNDGLVKDFLPALKAALEAHSCETLQMRATIGGNLLQNTRCLFYNQSEFWRKSKGFCLKMGGEKCNAVPGAKRCFANYCSDTATALSTLSAELELAGPGGERRIPLDQMYSGKPGKPFALEQGEILTAILIPKKKTIGGYEKLRLRGAVDYPLLGVAFSSFDGTGRLAVGAVGAKPYVGEVTQPWQDTVGEVATALRKDATAVNNTVVDAEYRKRMIPVLAERLVKQVMEGTE